MIRTWISGWIICLLFVTLMSCASKPKTLTLNFTADHAINSDVLLPVDVIVTPDPVMKNILDVGPEDWFGHQSRDILLGDELFRMAISGGSEQTKEVVLDEDISKVIIYADYDETMNREDQQLIINCSDKKKQYDILIRERNLEMKK